MTYSETFRVKPRSRLELAQLDPRATGATTDKAEAALLLAQNIQKIATAQELLFAQDNWALLIVFQAMDAAGKDSAIKHVMSGVNPKGCRVVSFVAPTKEEANHDYLWRTVKALPERGCIAIHNRSHYEEVIVTRVHPDILANQHLPEATRTPDLLRRRFREVNRFERYLVDNGTLVLKFFLHISKHEQWRRFSERMEDPDKYWKFQLSDLRERAHWDEYMAAYEEVFRHTSTTHAPWFIVPADHKWFARLAVAEIIHETLASLKLQYPKVPDAVRAQWRALRAELEKG